MTTKRRNNIISTIHRVVTSEHGENYSINGCAKYVMECLGEKNYDYWFFTGITGDLFTQHYSYTNFVAESVSDYLFEEDPARFVEETFAKCGYAATFVSSEELKNNIDMYLQMLSEYIYRGIPVIGGNMRNVFVGYEDYGKVLLQLTTLYKSKL